MVTVSVMALSCFSDTTRGDVAAIHRHEEFAFRRLRQGAADRIWAR
jgi:hypothetical protein